MSRTYIATGINLKSMPLGEYDRLLTILTAEQGLIRVVAPGARKHLSKLGGRSALFVVNQLQIVEGRTLHKVIQAETLASYPRLNQDLCKLTAGQYLAELALCQALSQQPQAELFHLLTEHLSRLERLPKISGDPAAAATIELAVLSHLVHATFHLLALAGIAPQVQICCLTQQPLVPDFTDGLWQAGFSVAAGGTLSQDAILHERREANAHLPSTLPRSTQVQPVGVSIAPWPTLRSPSVSSETALAAPTARVAASHATPYRTLTRPESLPPVQAQISALELALLQHLAQPDLPDLAHQAAIAPQGSSLLELQQAWFAIERLLRQYSQYHFERPIRAAALLETCFVALSTPV